MERLRATAILFGAALIVLVGPISGSQPPVSVEHSSLAEEVAFAAPPLRTLRRTLFGDTVTLEAFPVVRSDRRRPQLWVSIGHVSLLRIRRRSLVFRRAADTSDEVDRLLATLQLGSPADFRALAVAANRDLRVGGGSVTECQFVRLRLTQLTCTTVLRLADGFELPVRGSAKDLQAGRGTTVVSFNLPGGLLSDAVLNDLETRGELTCQLRVLGSNGSEAYNHTVRLRASEALEDHTTTAELAARPCAGLRSQPAVKPVAVYNFRSQWRADNLVASGRYKVTAKGKATFTADGVELPGNSWLAVDTEGGSLTEHMKYGSRWSVFFMYKRPASASPRQRATLFSVHRAGNPLACSILAWTSGHGQASVYTRVHNLAEGYSTGERTTPELDIQPGAWNRVGISFDGVRQLVVINGAAVRAEAVYRLPSYRSFTPDGLRTALSIGLVKGPEHSMQGTFRCFGVTRGSLLPEEYQDLFDQYCQ